MSDNDEKTVEAQEAGAKPAPKCTDKRKRLGITLVCVVAVLVVAGAGFMVWHEQPSFCNAICHDPMDPYLPTFEATPGEPATDKWGNEVEDAGSMLAAVHNQVGKTCMDCHVPQLDEQMTEGMEWVSGNYDSPLGERTATQLVEARGLENSDEFCMNSSCHPYGRDELEIAEKAKLDGWYVEHLSFGLDVKCFFGTIAAVLRHDGVVEGGTGTLHEETGKENH